MKHFPNLKWIFSIFLVINICQFKILHMKNSGSAFKNIETKCFRVACLRDFIFLTSAACWIGPSLQVLTWDLWLHFWMNKFCLKHFSMSCSWQKLILTTTTFSFFQLGSRSERLFFLYLLTARGHLFSWSKSAELWWIYTCWGALPFCSLLIP